MYKKLNPKFKQHQLPVVQTFLKKYKNSEDDYYSINTIMTTPTGYQERTDNNGDGSFYALDFNKKDKTISCGGGHNGDMVHPDNE